jgi:hypothetical protein
MFINILSQLLLSIMGKRKTRGRPKLNDKEKASFTTKLSGAVRKYLKENRLDHEKSYNSTLLRVLGLKEEEQEYTQ